MTIISSTRGNPMATDIAVENALPTLGTASRNDLQATLTTADSAFQALFEDRSAMFVGGGTVSYNTAGTTLTFGERLDFTYNNAGTQQTIQSIVAAAGTLSFSANGHMAYIVVTKGSPGSAALTQDATSLPAATTSQEVFLYAVRRDDTGGTKRLYFAGGKALAAGESSGPSGDETQFLDSEFAVNDATDNTKQFKVDAAGTTGTATTLQTSQTTNRTVTLPDATDTLVAIANSNTAANRLQNKDLDAGSTNIVDPTDPTKKLNFNVASKTTGTSLTVSSQASGAQSLNWPLSSPDTLLGRVSSDTGASRLKNKDLDSTSTNVVDTSDTSKKLAFSTSGATTATTLTLAESQSTSQSLAIPNVGSGDTLVTNNTTATLSAKTMQTLTGAVVTDSTTTGADATLTAGDITDTVVRLTNASLTSVGGIPAGGSGQVLIVENQTGTTIFINDNDSVATAANRIRTGTSGAVSMPSNATFVFTYDSTAARWMLTGGSGSGSGSDGKNYLALSSSVQGAWTTPITGNTVAISTDTTAADLPRAITTGTGIKFTPSSTSYALTSISNASPAVFTLAGHGLREGLIITLTTSGSLPTGLSTGTAYYVHFLTSSTFNVALTMSNLLAGIYVNTSSAGSGTHTATFGFGQARFTLDAADYNVKQQVQWAQNQLTGDSTDWEVDIYSNTASDYSGTYTRLYLSTDTTASSTANSYGGATLLPNLEGTFKTTFDAPGSAQQYIEIRIQRADADTHSLVLSDIVVGPGQVVQGAAVTGWTSYTPTVGNLSTSAATALYRRVGESVEIVGSWTASAQASGTITFSLPTGLTINTSVMPTANSNSIFGTAYLNPHTGNLWTGVVNYDSATTVHFATSNTGNSWNATVPLTGASADIGNFKCVIPVNEWAGGGTVNVVNNDVSYVYNTGGTTSAGGSDTTSFGYGPSGVAIGNINASTTTGTSTTSFTVQFPTPIQVGDQMMVQVDQGTGGAQWVDIGQNQNIAPFTVQGTAVYGIGLSAPTSNQVIVNFGNAGRNSSSTYGAAGTSWASISSWKWRVKKFSGGNAVGFANYQPGVSAGLVTAAGLSGNTTQTFSANSYNSGTVGEYLEAVQTSGQSCTSNSTIDVLSSPLVLTPGTWDITGLVNFLPASTTTIQNFQAWIGTPTAGASVNGRDQQRNVAQRNLASSGTTVLGANNEVLVLPVWRVSISSNTNYYLKASGIFTTSTMTATGSLRATRAF